jgi:hypothetical protein
MKENYDLDTLKDIVEHGVSAGFPGLSYYSDTCTLYELFKDEIWERLVDDADEFGYKNVYEFIATFNGANVGNCVQHENLLVWYMAERIAQDIIDEIEEAGGN